MMSWFDLMRQAQGSPDLDTLARQFNLSTEQAQKAMAAVHGVTIIGVKSPGQEFVYAKDETRISANDLLVVSGHSDLLDRFAARP